MTEARRFGVDFTEMARERQVEFERPPGHRVVVTAMKTLTPLGDELQTFEGLLTGASGVRALPDTQNFRTNIGAPLDFDPREYYSTRDLRRMSDVVALADILSRQAVAEADLVGSDGMLKQGIRRRRFGVWIGSGLGPADGVIDVDRAVHRRDGETGEINFVTNSRNIDFNSAIRLFPQDLSGRPAISLGAQGWSGTIPAACASGATNITELFRLITDGYLDAGVAGGVEFALNSHPKVAIGVFARMEVLSQRNDDPQRASRPYDRHRDGFVIGSGGAIVVLEREDLARARGATILAEVFNARNSVDGKSPTGMDVDNVAATIQMSLQDLRNQTYYKPDAIFAHATSTKDGDPNEAEAISAAYGIYTSDIPVTAIKGNVGHLVGAAGAVNFVTSALSVQRDVVPQIANYEERDEKIPDLLLVTKQPLQIPVNIVSCVAYGFGGFNSALTVGKYIP